MTATEETTPLQPDLPDVLRILGELAHIPTMGRRGRQILFELAHAGDHVEKFEGLVIEGEVYGITWRQEFAVCKCGDGKHEYRRDAPHGRGHWHEARRDVDALLAVAVNRWSSWEKHRPEPHMVTQVVATTSTEKVA